MDGHAFPKLLLRIAQSAHCAFWIISIGYWNECALIFIYSLLPIGHISCRLQNELSRSKKKVQQKCEECLHLLFIIFNNGSGSVPLWIACFTTDCSCAAIVSFRL